ncbi:hypothetical protein [Heyndrickxia coagulans]|uniref:hypothetical protein n=1 Tax=Heyndrickxia coagulans TaxID=1398 RepID=UPI00031965A7|nr:hypothetical protein [Heyndrickxia coagulans]
MAIKCVYSETLISAQHESHSRQFGETRDGDRLPIFSDNKAVIFVERDGRYRVKTTEDEILFIGTVGIDEAIGRVDYAQPHADVEINEGGRTYNREEYYRHIAPVVYLIAYDDDGDRLAIAYERRKNGRLLDDGTVIFADDGAFADWIAEQVEKEERPPVMRFDNRLPVSVQRRLAGLDINDEYQVEISRGTWPRIREKAKERMFGIAENKQKQAI